MNRFNFIPFLVGLVLLQIGCGEDAPDTGNRTSHQASELEGDWTALSMSVDGTDYPEAEQGTVRIHVAGNRISATSGCNSCQATFVRSGKNGIILTGDGWTEMGCDDPVASKLEEPLILLMGRLDHYAINEGQLTLSDGSDANCMVLERTQPPAPLPLFGTVWTLATFEEEEGVGEEATLSGAPVIGGVSIFLTFSEESASGSGGCSSFEAKVQAGGHTISLTELIATEEACNQTLKEQEQRFYAALQSSKRFDIVGNRLRLSNENRTVVLHFEGVE